MQVQHRAAGGRGAAPRRASTPQGIPGAEIQSFGSAQRLHHPGAGGQGGHRRRRHPGHGRRGVGGAGRDARRRATTPSELRRRSAPRSAASSGARRCWPSSSRSSRCWPTWPAASSGASGWPPSVATAHDILATIAFIAVMRIEVSLVVVGAVLSMVGYSLNDTIIIFDRVRENLQKYQRDELRRRSSTASINETLPRSVLTHATTLATLLALAIFGGEVIRPVRAGDVLRRLHRHLLLDLHRRRRSCCRSSSAGRARDARGVQDERTAAPAVHQGRSRPV